MKAELKTVEKQGFKPFKLELTIESEAEAKDLKHRLWIDSEEITESTKSFHYKLLRHNIHEPTRYLIEEYLNNQKKQ